MKTIPFLCPNLVKVESYQKYLTEIDAARWYSNFGPLNSLFEQRVVEGYFGRRGGATTVCNATAGLMAAIMLTKRPGARYAIMPSFTFPATPLAAVWCGLEPYFVDIREDDWCLDEGAVDELIERLGDQVAVVVPYAAFGTNMDLSYYRRLHESGMPVVVDGAASFGSTDENRQFGTDYSGPVVFSFHATKAFGIGEGGLVYSRDTDLISRIRQAANFGLSETRECVLSGLNGKLSEYAAAIALATLDIFATKVNIRRRLYRTYLGQLEQANMLGGGWRIQKVRGQVPFQFISLLCPEGRPNRDYVAGLAARGIESRTYFSPACHQQQRFASAKATPLPVTEEIARRVLSLPFWEEMTPDTIARVVEGLGSQ